MAWGAGIDFKRLRKEDFEKKMGKDAAEDLRKRTEKRKLGHVDVFLSYAPDGP